ncbi:MAG: HAD family hydrolase [Candidatus Bathyarchaeota archaeon]|nr:HAD family hydrolase [Candidatus Bathyarchaeota archaeon A05DMB-3]MDH7607724.1 HAD family hydrolase [Candidatus Bathyarchaeota archaeon]
MKYKGIRAVSFDRGGTLYYEVEEDYVVFHRILHELGYDFGVAEVERALHDARVWWNSEKAKTGEVWTERSWAKLLQRMAMNLTIPNTVSVADNLRERWLVEADFRAYEDAVPALNELKSAGFKLIVISNVSSGRNLQTYLRKAGIPNCFDAVIASGDVGYEKPSPEIFRIASRILNIPAGCILHVGDKYDEDYIGAYNAGFKAILIDRKGIYDGNDKPGEIHREWRIANGLLGDYETNKEVNQMIPKITKIFGWPDC